MKFLCRVALQGIGTPQRIHLQTFAVLTEAGEHKYKHSFANIFFSYFVLAELLNAQRHEYFFTEYYSSPLVLLPWKSVENVCDKPTPLPYEAKNRISVKENLPCEIFW